MRLIAKWSPAPSPDPAGLRQLVGMTTEQTRRLIGDEGVSFAPVVSASTGLISRRMTRALQVFPNAVNVRRSGTFVDITAADISSQPALSSTLQAMNRITPQRG